MDKNPVGRPAKPPDKRVSVTFQFRVRPDHDELIREAASKSGLSLSGWIRDRLLKAARRETR